MDQIHHSHDGDANVVRYRGFECRSLGCDRAGPRDCERCPGHGGAPNAESSVDEICAGVSSHDPLAELWGDAIGWHKRSTLSIRVGCE